MSNIKQRKIYLLTTLLLLTLSTVLPAIAYAAPTGTAGGDWQYTNANSWAQTYTPLNQIHKGNVNLLEVKWLFPLEPVSSASSALRSFATKEGSTTPPLVVDGKVIVSTNYLRTYAIDGENGAQIWEHNYVIDPDDIRARLPHDGLGDSLNLHQHGISYWENGNAVMINGMACDFYGIDLDTGETDFWVQDLCLNVPGNLYNYKQGTSATDGIATYDKGRQFIFVLSGRMHSTVFLGDARHVMMGIDMDTHNIVWRIFNFPPQDVPTKDWALQECDIGFFRDIPCSDVAAAAPENLEWDWAEEGQTPSPYGGVTSNWGHTPSVDEDTGILYTETGNQGPYTYVGATPGPRLYGSTIMAIDMDEGKRIWWNQPMPRDMYDYDCNWDGILADVPSLGKVYMKGCKEGRLHVLDAETGEPIYLIDVVNEMVEWGQIGSAALTEPYEGQGGIRYHTMDPMSYYDMREIKSPDNSNYCGRPCTVFPYWMNGVFATDMSYDPETATLFHYALALQTTIQESPPPEEGGTSFSIARSYPIQNTSIVARDAATGNVKWRYYYPTSWIRSHITVTPELVFTGFNDGMIRFLDKSTGALVHEMNLGSPQVVGWTTGVDSSGDQKIFTIIGISIGTATVISPAMSGTVVALGLSERAAEAVTTTVTTISTTSTTRTVTSTSASTTTVTSEVTETTGLPAEYTYAAVAVAVIAIIAAAFLFMRRR